MGGRPGTIVDWSDVCGDNKASLCAGGFATAARHQGGSNFILCDGHVKWMYGEQVSTGWMAATPNDFQDATYTGGGANSVAAGSASLSNTSGKKVFEATFSPL